MTDEIESTLSALWDEVDDAADEAREHRGARLDPVIARIERQLEIHDDPRLWYMLGYARYAHPDRRASPRIQRGVEEALGRVLATVPDDALARLYLGHHFYDLARHDEALSWCLTVDLDGLDPYLQLKALEMLVCCRLRIGGADGAREELERFVARCEHHDPDDIEPLNLWRALRDLASGGAQLDALAPMLARLDEIGRHRWFDELVG